MNPNLHKHIYAAVALLVAGMVAAAYLNSRSNVDRAEQVKQDVQQQIASLRGDLQKSLATIQQDRQQVKTPEQVVRIIPQYVQLPTPPMVARRPDDNTPSTTTDSGLPDAPSKTAQDIAAHRNVDHASSTGVYFPPEDVKPLFDSLADGKACGLKLDACQKESDLLTQRAKAAEKAMKGGGFWNRLKSNSKFLFYGAVGTAGILCGTGHCK